MFNHLNLQDKVIATEDKLNIGSIINQALIDILITKKIISEEELVNYIGKIKLQQEIFFDGTKKTV
ncbi:MAG: hypothetical protein WBD61_11870 [Desulfobulbales bacterium]